MARIILHLSLKGWLARLARRLLGGHELLPDSRQAAIRQILAECREEEDEIEQARRLR